MDRIKRSALVLVVMTAMVGVSSLAFADWGRGPGGDGPWEYCPNFNSGRGASLSDEQIGQLSQERQAFFDATKDLRNDVWAKRLELRAEMAKQAPDAEKVMALQKDVSGMKAALAEKRTAHILKMKEIAPDLLADADGFGQGFRGRGGRMGYGPRGGHMMGYGPMGGYGGPMMGYGPRGGHMMGYGPRGGYGPGAGYCWQD